MKYKKFEVFGEDVLICKLENELDTESMICDIENQLKTKKLLVENNENTFTDYSEVNNQSKLILFTDHPWEGSKNESWNILGSSFLDACQIYAEQFDPKLLTYRPSIVGWFFKEERNEEEFNPVWHTHEYSYLTGVFNLKLNNAESTLFMNTDGELTIIPEASQDNMWIIFPSNIIHSGNFAVNNPRYIIAADFHPYV